MTYAETVRFLYELRLHGLKLGLENTRRLASLAGNPQARLQFIHVAGTNGKGSTCAMLESIYRAAGFRVGLFTSPHLSSFRERIQVNRSWISEDEVVRRVVELQGFLEEFPREQSPTFFEVVTVLALVYFAEQRCDLVMWETGMGGRLDATNLVRPLASVITNVQLDHQKWLGSTCEAIAREKAGIIKPGVPVITGTEDREALEVIRRVAADSRSELEIVTSAQADSAWLGEGHLSLRGRHQRRNAALALRTVAVLQERIAVDATAIQQGLARLEWAGRMQQVVLGDGRRFLLDGAHNASGMEALLRGLDEPGLPRQAAFVLGMLNDKDWESMCELVGRVAARVVLVPIRSERSAVPGELAAVCRRVAGPDRVTTADSLAVALERLRPEPLVVVAGSLYLVGEALELLGLGEGRGDPECQLNEWVPAKTPGG